MIQLDKQAKTFVTTKLSYYAFEIKNSSPHGESSTSLSGIDSLS